MKTTATPKRSVAQLRADLAAMELRALEAEQVMEAIRSGEAESVVVDAPGGARIFSLEGAADSYRLLVQEMNEGAATVNTEGVILYANACLGRMLNRPLERVMGSTLLDHVAPRFHGALAVLLQRAVREDVREELAFLNMGGDNVPALLSMRCMDDGGVPVLCLVATDLREQQRSVALVEAERAARASEARYRAVLENSRDLYVVLDARREPGGGRVAWTIRDMNHAGLAAVLSTRAALLGKSPRLVSPERFSELEQGWTRVLETGDPWHYQHSYRGRHYLVRVHRIDETAVVSASVDITEFSEAQEALRRSEAGLREADRRKTEFLAMLSHELRNPLAPIKTSLHILARVAPGSDAAQRANAVMVRQVQHLARLVDDLLDVNRISLNKVALRLERLDLVEVVGRALDDHRALFEAKGVALTARLGSQPLTVQGDADRLAQVVGNLLLNAVKFTDAGGTVTVFLAPDTQPGRALLRVQDTGAGIAADTLTQLFLPFSQADRTLDRSDGGLGLGLAVVKGIVELHGGKVAAHSEGPGLGSEFSVVLPLQEKRVTTETVASTPPSGQTLRILVVEDNEDIALSLQEVLAMDGHQVEVAYDGPQGLKTARRFGPRVVLCDIGLPGMDGYAVARAFREDPNLQGAFLVALTGYALPEDRTRATEAGFDQHLAKPPNLKSLEDLLAKVAASDMGHGGRRAGVDKQTH